ANCSRRVLLLHPRYSATVTSGRSDRFLVICSLPLRLPNVSVSGAWSGGGGGGGRGGGGVAADWPSSRAARSAAPAGRSSRRSSKQDARSARDAGVMPRSAK